MDENGRASFGLANSDDAVDTNCAAALDSVHGLTLPVLALVVKMGRLWRVLHGGVTPDKERQRRQSGAYWKNAEAAGCGLKQEWREPGTASDCTFFR